MAKKALQRVPEGPNRPEKSPGKAKTSPKKAPDPSKAPPDGTVKAFLRSWGGLGGVLGRSWGGLGRVQGPRAEIGCGSGRIGEDRVGSSEARRRSRRIGPRDGGPGEGLG